MEFLRNPNNGEPGYLHSERANREEWRKAVLCRIRSLCGSSGNGLNGSSAEQVTALALAVIADTLGEYLSATSGIR